MLPEAKAEWTRSQRLLGGESQGPLGRHVGFLPELNYLGLGGGAEPLCSPDPASLSAISSESYPFQMKSFPMIFFFSYGFSSY